MSDELKHIIPFFIPHLGCPHQCIFCNQLHVSGKSSYPKDNEIAQAINEWQGKELPEIAFYGGSFSGLSFSWQRYFLTPAFEALQKNKIRGIRISTRPDYINHRVLSFLLSFGVRTVELGVQSLDEQVLSQSHRGHGVEDIFQALTLLKKQGFNTGVQLMPGLPGDSREKSIKGTFEIARMEPDMARIYPTLVLKDTPLHKLFLEESYHPLSLYDAVTISRDMLAIFRYYGVKVIRTGLQPTKDIAEGAQVVDGPFHPAFGELTASALAKEHIIMIMKEFLPVHPVTKVILWVSPRDCSIIAGHKRSNIDFLKKHFKLEEIKIKKLNNIERGNIGLSQINAGKPDLIISENQFLLQYVTEKLMAICER